MADRCRTWCFFRTSGVQWAALVGAVLWSIRSIRERLSGGGEMTGPSGTVGKGVGKGGESEGLGRFVVGSCVVCVGGGFVACSTGMSVSVGVLTGLSITVLSGAVGVLGLVGGGEGGSGWGGGDDGGVVVGVGSCGVGAGECLAGSLLRRFCRLVSTGFLCRDAVVEFGGRCVGRVGREVG